MPDTLLRPLVDELVSPEPVVRDERAYAGLSALVRAGDLEPPVTSTRSGSRPSPAGP